MEKERRDNASCLPMQDDVYAGGRQGSKKWRCCDILRSALCLALTTPHASSSKLKPRYITDLILEDGYEFQCDCLSSEVPIARKNAMGNGVRPEGRRRTFCSGRSRVAAVIVAHHWTQHHDASSICGAASCGCSRDIRRLQLPVASSARVQGKAARAAGEG